ncbi:unnamed protein product [Clonostachys rosea]|uniref:AAA+ ATPase domain-containing protein n=1 Tax=Bionectria ochroleuca TaxID=29856 RepID=A0ABY6UNG9_BIOOC|nr:unnamed protein product [Clonostachys rosea]
MQERDTSRDTPRDAPNITASIGRPSEINSDRQLAFTVPHENLETFTSAVSVALENINSPSTTPSASKNHQSTANTVPNTVVNTLENAPQMTKGMGQSSVYRTIIAQTGSAPEAKNYSMFVSEQKYDEVVPSYVGVAFEMRKTVRTIDGSGLLRQGNHLLLNGEYVDSVISEVIIIWSPQLLKTIKDTVYWPTSAFYDGQKNLTINSPYHSIGVYRDELGGLLDLKKQELDDVNRAKTSSFDIDMKDTENEPSTSNPYLPDSDLETTVSHLEQLLHEVDKVQNAAVEAEYERYSSGMATFDMLWKLFKPGTVVYADADGVILAGRVKLLVWGHGSIEMSGPDDPYQTVEVIMWYLDHDGTFINRRSHSVVIQRFHGQKPIRQLPVYPEKYYPDYKKHREKRIERGEKFIRLVSNHHALCNYNGMVSYDDETPYKKQNYRAYQGQLIVDPEQHYREEGWSEDALWLDEGDVRENTTGTELKSFIRLNPIQKSTKDLRFFFGEDQLFLLPEWLRSFTIAIHGIRKWDERDKNILHTLKLEPEQNKELLQSMTYVPSAYDNSLDDLDCDWSPELIEHKGKGRIIILHGVPGVGKTYTVECMAEWSDREGLDAETLEIRLDSYLRRAERWKAIVLLDEADVYMTARNSLQVVSDTAIVSVFLRALEYFSGIMFLTTNRVHAIDQAVINRALLIMEYKPLSAIQISTIAGNCIKRFRKLSSMEIGDGEADYYKSSLQPSAYDWDGREIVQGWRFPEI